MEKKKLNISGVSGRDSGEDKRPASWLQAQPEALQRRRRGIIFKIIFSFIICLFGALFWLPTKNVSAMDFHLEDTLSAIDALSVDVSDKKVKESVEKTWYQEVFNWLAEETMWAERWSDGHWTSIAWKSALSKFLDRFAYDAAIYLATGDKGQAPMFETDSLGEFTQNAADYAAGDFLEAFGRESPLKFNVCEPSFGLTPKIGLSLTRKYRPKEPECTFSKMKDNWDEELKRPDFLNRFQNMFNPWENDLGITLGLSTGMEEAVSKKVNEKVETLIMNQGIKPLKNLISDNIKTPAIFTRKIGEKVIDESTGKEKIYTGDIIADSISVFTNTLIGKLMDEWFNKGLVSDFPDNSYKGNWGGFSDYESGGYSGGISGAKERFRKLVEPEFGVRGDYNILNELTSCPKQDKAGPTNCVITDNFRQAVINKMTVGQAIKEGYLNANGIFGFTADGLEPSYYDNAYPYRSMAILRKFRILPVGWELAAQFIKDNPGQSNGIKNLGDLAACFDPNDQYTGYGDPPGESWCEGLVDPNWVLKAPLNYCRREGPGPEITSEQVTGKGYDSVLAVSRDDNYCADEQTCIKENDDGSCELYGYCVEERRVWTFNGQSCEPKYNTCETFRGRDGGTVSFLENTLEYGDCGFNNVGCLGYCEDYDYAISNFTCAINSGDRLFLNKEAEECDSADEGCHEFIRTKAGTGANLVRNSSFEDGLDDWYLSGASTPNSATTAIESYYGAYSLWNNNPAGSLTGHDQHIYGIRPNEEITISYYVKTDIDTNTPDGAWVLVYAMNSSDQILAPTGRTCSGHGQTDCYVMDLAYTGGGAWQRIEYSFVTPANVSYLIISARVWGIAGQAWFDAIKVERGGEAGAYGDYRDNGLVYIKAAPSYLGCTRADTDPFECGAFALFCNEDEVGCELYTSATTGMTVPAKAEAKDYCPVECVGYKEYLQLETRFDAARLAYFIPKTAKSCGAQSVGCDEFTNLDKLEQGGEEREYYTYLRRCNKPSISSNCTEFYTWEGSSETGYQLRAHPLSEEVGGAPETLPGYNPTGCTEAIYNSLPGDPVYNPDCREFYSRAGNVYYVLYSWTITCSEDCHPYRRRDLNYDPAIIAQGGCANGNLCNDPASDGDDGCWDSAAGQCVICRNGGYWAYQHGACIYEAVPGESRTCGAGQAGCREYSGPEGRNTRIITHSDFEGSFQGWSGINGTTAELSNENLRSGGNSLYAYGGSRDISLNVGTQVDRGRSYVIRFVAKAVSGAMDLTVSLDNGLVNSPFTGSAQLNDANWDIYELNLADLGHDATTSESLIINGSGAFYIDDIRLTEIRDRYFLIRDSWGTPESCDEDIYGNPWAQYMLNCDIYNDRENQTHYLHDFTKLCLESAVGCEVMIDTHNYSGYTAEAWNDVDSDDACGPADDADCEAVSADNFVYMVYDIDKSCSLSDKGCQLLGMPYHYENYALHDRVYRRNDPDLYNYILCQISGQWCEEWTSKKATAYFKDSGDQICEWRQAQGDSSGWAWYKKMIKRCDSDPLPNGDGVITQFVEVIPCLDSGDCADGISCIADSNDYDCAVSEFKTLGRGGAGSMVDQPRIDDNGYYWAGLCPADQAGCSEYVDPVSRFSYSVIYNADFSLDVDIDGLADGWSATVNGTQDIVLEPHTLYILSVEGANTATVRTVSNANVFYVLASNNILDGTAAVNTVSVMAGAGQRVSIRFYTDRTISGEQIDVIAANAGVPNGSKIELKKAIVDYQMAQELDKQNCNGVVDFEAGCVLFNERARSGAAPASLIFDADLTVQDAGGVPPESGAAGEDDSNILLKVTPDRVCNKWLACRSFIKDEDDNNVCFDIGLCDAVDENGNCDSFLISEQNNQTYPNPVTAGIAGNMSGYVKTGYSGSGLGTNYFPLAAMDEVGEVANVSNGGFEFAGENGYPIGWTPFSGLWNENLFSIINNPVAAQEEGIDYPVEGRNFLKFSSENVVNTPYSDFIDVEPNTDYVISAYINTLNFNSKNTNTVAFYLDVNSFDTLGASLLGSGIYNYQTLDNSQAIIRDVMAGYGWRFFSGKFRANAFTTKLRLQLVGYTLGVGVVDCRTDIPARDNCVGNIYIDDIKIRPALNNKDNENIIQTCRLYPEDDSLSCDYYDDSWIKQKGWLGYCLEYDRYPGSEDACLLWWPVDKVKGEGIEEGAGYADRFPLYYSIDDATQDAPVSLYDIFGVFSADQDGDSTVEIIEGNHGGAIEIQADQFDFGKFDFNTYMRKGFIDRIEIGVHNSGYLLTLDISDDVGGDWWDRAFLCDSTWGQGNLASSQLCENTVVQACQGTLPQHCRTVFGYQKICDHGRVLVARAMFDADNNFTTLRMTACDKSGDAGGQTIIIDSIRIYLSVPFPLITQVVTSVGQNKYWSGRVYEGSAYSFPCNAGLSGVPATCEYFSDYPPFGAIVQPDPPHNPYEWDSKRDIDGIQPLYYEFPNINLNEPYQPRLGQLHTIDAVKRLFAKNYGTWRWNNAAERYESVNGFDWGPPNIVCDGVLAFHALSVDCTGGCTGSECSLWSSNIGAYIEGQFAHPILERAGTCDKFEPGDHSGCEVAILDFYQNSCDGEGWRIEVKDNLADPWVVIANDHNTDPEFTSLPGGCTNYYLPVYYDISASGYPQINYIRIETTSLGNDNDCGTSWDGPDLDLNNVVGYFNTGLSVRSSYPGDYCAIPPVISNIKANDELSRVTIAKNGFINLTFNSMVDSQQLPLVMYAVDWGDNEDLTVSGVEMRDRINPDNPHSLYHLYSYWDLKAKHAVDQIPDINSVYCGIGGNNTASNYNNATININPAPANNYCAIQPGVKIKDNWGWCNNGINGNSCPAGGYKRFNDGNGWVVVTER